MTLDSDQTMDPEAPPFDLVAVEVALDRAGRVARRRAAEMPRVRARRRLDAVLDLAVRMRIAARDTVKAWRAGRLLSRRESDMVGAEVALHRAARVAHRRAAEMSRRRAEARLDAELDAQVRARTLARFGVERSSVAAARSRG